ncbi:MAG: AbrB/MazE/SpoVT family DNA-binding domain-containing protein [Candidatus Asgardarchaeia archaeon]
MSKEIVEVKTSVGTKGEIYIPKKIREQLGLKPKDKIIIRVKNGQIIIIPVKDFEELLSKKPEVEISLDDFHKFRRELSESVE